MAMNMTAQDFAAGLLADARRQAAQIEEEGRAEVERLDRETAELVEQEGQRVLAQARRARDELAARAEAKRQRQAAQAILAAKQQLIDETFAAAEQELARMPAAKRRALVKNLLDRAKREIPVGSVIVARRDTAAVRGVKATAAEGLGGFVAASKDGKLRVDMRFESLLADVKERRSDEIAGILFAERAKTRPIALKAQRRKPSKASPRARRRA